MGHLFLGKLPKTYRWKHVIQLLDENSSVAEISVYLHLHKITYRLQKTDEQADILKKLLSNCTIKGATLCPTYRTPFNLLLETPKSELWRRR